MTSRPLKRILGMPTALLIGMGVAIGSGIFRTPGDVAESIPDARFFVAAWVIGGLVVLIQGMVTAELATRFPKAGGEYVFLREAYGEFPAFFFGWAYTIFVIGGGAASIAAAFGDFSCDLFNLDVGFSGALAAAAIIVITGVNAVGLRTGAGIQNVLTGVKIVALLAVAVLGFVYGGENGATSPVLESPSRDITLPLFLTAMLPILWSYNGTTDAAKLAEEIKDVRRALPRALIGSALALTLVYVVFNVALLRLMPLSEMHGHSSVPGEVMGRIFGSSGRGVMLVVAMLVCLGALSSTVLATIRVTFALARDGLAFRFMSHMSKSQAPVPALVVVGVVSVVLVLNRKFDEVLQIYFLASALLFGLSYASLIVFRFRETTIRREVFRCPFGIGLALFLILLQIALAINIISGSPKDAAITGLLLLAIGAFYFVWKRLYPRRPEVPNSGTSRARNDQV